ncbi:hypothetical protein EJD97_016368, partial [Solanum chilense]
IKGEQVLLKVSPMKGVMRFGKRGKLSPRYIGLFEVIKRVGEVAYELALPPGLSGVHPEPVAILDSEIRKLRSREIASIKVQWKNRPVEESTWEKRLICKKDTQTCLQIQVLLFALVFLLVIVRGRTMGKTVLVDGSHDRPSWARRTVEGVSFQNT